MTHPFLPPSWPTDSDWTSKLTDHFQSDSFRRLCDYVHRERADYTVYPSVEDVFQAFRLTPYAQTRVVILGQDPYHGLNQAHGLAFSVLPGIKLPPSLKNIYKELADDAGIHLDDLPLDGELTSWAEQGVMLLNTVLTVREADAHSHRKQGWEQFTDHVIARLNAHPENLVFILWGKPAAKKKSMIDARHVVLESPHPSPLSSYRGFFGSKPFSKSNAAIEESGRSPIIWESILARR